MFRALPPSAISLQITDILAGIFGSFRGKKAIQNFKDEICRYFGVKYCFLASSGRGALSLLLSALHKNSPEKNEVAIPAYTSFSVPSAVVHAGLKVSLYDLDSKTMSPDEESLRKTITGNTLCIMACHLYGYVADMNVIISAARSSGTLIIDDAAQAMGAKFQGKFAGTIGKAGLFSLSRGKNITTIDGGIIVTDCPELAMALEASAPPSPGLMDSVLLLFKALMLMMLVKPWCYWLPRRLPFLKVGVSLYNPDFKVFGYTSFQAGMGSRMLKRLKDINSERQVKARVLMEKLHTQKMFKVPAAFSVAEPVFLRLPLFVAGIDRAVNAELGMVRSYPSTLDGIEELQPHITNRTSYPGAGKLAEQLVTLPTHRFVRNRDVENMIRHLRTMSQERGKVKALL